MSATSDLYRRSRHAAAWGLAVSLGLGLAKFLGGVFGHSLALFSDALHSLIDAALSGGLMAALAMAERPADREHPYGHGRLEAVAGAGMAILLLALAAMIAYEAIVTLGNQHEPPHVFAVVIAALAALFQEGLFRYTSRIARETGSGALLAAAWDARLDALGGIAVIAGILIARWGGPRWAWADHAAALVIAATVFWIGLGLLRDKVRDLMDHQAPSELLAEVRASALSVAGVMGVETLLMRKAGLEYLVDIHIEVDPNLTVEVGHAIAHAVKDRIKSGMRIVRDVLVHVEPTPSLRLVEPKRQQAN